MKKSPRSLDLVLAAACLALLSNAPTVKAQTAPPGALEVPAKTIPVPTTVSPQLQKIIGAPLRSNWDIHPKTGEEWKPVADAGAAALVKNVPGMLERLKVKVEKTTIDGVRAYIVTPETIAPENRNRQLIHMHGGCYVLNPGEAGLPEAIDFLVTLIREGLQREADAAVRALELYSGSEDIEAKVHDALKQRKNRE